MWLKIILLMAFCAGAVWVGLINACPAHFVEVRSWDGYKVLLPPRMSDEEMAAQLRAHDTIAERTLAIQDPRGPATTLRGPEGLTYVYGPGMTRDEYMPTLRKVYGPEMAERVASGEFLHTLGPEQMLVQFLIGSGLSEKEARALVEDTPSYVYRKAYAEALQEQENARQEEIRNYVPPLRRTVEERVAEARAKVAVSSWAFCRFLWW
jgi:hypothetical protein